MKVTFLELHIGHYVDAVVTCSGNSVQSRPVDAVDLADYQMWRLFDQQGCQPSQFLRKPPDFETRITIVRFGNENSRFFTRTCSTLQARPIVHGLRLIGVRHCRCRAAAATADPHVLTSEA